ncbi:MAG: hypothetical protein OXJ37_07480 [Bryobacterales bacterium]|nr:hypothetical protein [Bryobacterales bacterium]MDE0262225.1 hypothetical protein [Bryobacterales bacterium]MDE0620216.1 hypothetical protein [Bryobacterales bacterium]
MGAKLVVLLGLAAASALGSSVRGRIVTDDGMPLPASAQVALRCGTPAKSEVGIDLDGWFELSNLPDSVGCSVTVTARGYRTASVSLAELPADPLIPAAVLHRLGKNHGESISVTHLAAPADARGHFHAAVRVLEQETAGAIDRALDHLQSAVRAYPAYAQAWFEIGRLQLALADASGALQAFQQSVQADPWFVSPYEPLLLLLRSNGDAVGAERACAKLRQINPALPPGCGGG